jgi:hypothetical protein
MKKGVEAQAIAEEFLHNGLHTSLLLKKYEDLRVEVTGQTVDYYSTRINQEVDQFQFEKNTVTTYVFIHSCYPYKNVKIDCSRCDGLIRVNANPSRIPLILEHELVYAKDYAWYALAYEDFLKSNSFNQMTLTAVQLHIIKELEAKKGKKVDTFYLNNSIKRLLPFT